MLSGQCAGAGDQRPEISCTREDSTDACWRRGWRRCLKSLTQPMDPPGTVVRQGHLALLKRWYYRPEVKREGEVFFPDAEGQWPISALSARRRTSGRKETGSGASRSERMPRFECQPPKRFAKCSLPARASIRAACGKLSSSSKVAAASWLN